MITSIGQTSAENKTPADGHRLMTEVRAVFLELGLTELVLVDGYDASETGDDSQIPITENGTSKWMAFAFSDTHQSDYPITIRIRCNFVETGYTNVYRYLLQCSVSQGIDGSDATIGSVLTSINGGEYATSSSYEFAPRSATSGDFARYTGDSLLIVKAAKGYRRITYPSYKAGLFIYIERARDSFGGIIEGFFATVNRIPFDSRTSTAETSGSHSVYFHKSQFEMQSSSDCYLRAAGSLGETDNGAFVVSPLFYRPYTQDKIIPTSKVFTIPTTALGGADVATPLLNFAGEEKRYLCLSPAAVGGYPGMSNYSWVLEWQ